MTSVITGDIINSRKAQSPAWLKHLKKTLKHIGDNPKAWEIYRGDSFQLEVKQPEEALAVAIQLKAAIKTVKGMDVRMAIGIGDKTHAAKNITESNGTAFVHSGESAEQLKKHKLTMVIKSGDVKFDREMNLYLKLALIIMNGWTRNAAAAIYTVLQYPDKSQEELGKILKIKQNAVSTRLKRACYDEIMELDAMYRGKIGELK